jgi:hypothetical protein
MDLGLGLLLSSIGIFLVGGLIAMIGAAASEAKLDPGVQPAESNRRTGRKATIIGAVIVVSVVIGGNFWWNAEAADYDTRIYKPLHMAASLHGSDLALQMTEPGWMQPGRFDRVVYRVFTRKMDDLVPDHSHIMHLYAIRQPDLDVIYHLHPEQRESGTFFLALPSIVAGHYKLYADIVHADGFPETMTAQIDLPSLNSRNSRSLAGDDSSAAGQPAVDNVFTLPDGYKMQWLRPSKPIHVHEPLSFTFRLTKSDGSVPPDMALYMGMLGHAAFVKTDGTVFAHIHPNGSISMAALMLAQGMPADMEMTDTSRTLPNVVSFPFGFPSPGKYRVFVQMKRAEIIETGIFDVVCEAREKDN